MENRFDFNRFCKVFEKDLKSLWTRFGLTMLIIILIPSAIWLLFSSAGGVIPSEVRISLIYMCVLLASIMAPSRLYKYCNTPNLGIHFAMLPASKSEKFWSMVLITALVVPVIAFCAMLLLDVIMTPFRGAYTQWIFEAFYGTGTKDLLQLWLGSLMAFYATAATFFFTATLFKKHKVVRTFLWSMLIGFVLFLFGLDFLQLLSYYLSPRFFRMVEGIADYDFRWGYVAVIAFLSLWVVAFYGAAYYRLKRMKY